MRDQINSIKSTPEQESGVVHTSKYSNRLLVVDMPIGRFEGTVFHVYINTFRFLYEYGNDYEFFQQTERARVNQCSFFFFFWGGGGGGASSFYYELV